VKHRALTPSGFGWQLEGYDPHQDPDSIRDAFHASGGLILIREQGHLAPESLAEFAAIFGELELNEKYDPDFLLPSHPEILRIGNLRDPSEPERYRSLFTRADPPPLLWHCDDSFRDPQPLGSCILCIETPPEGGETGFAGMSAAYDALPADTKTRLRGLTTQHSYDFLNEYLRRRNPHRLALSEELRAQHPPVERPLVAEHPRTGRKSLYLPKCHIERVHGLSPDEGESLIDELLAHATAPAFALLHRWAPGDLVVWDNRCTLHAPSPFDDVRYDRLLYRLTMRGEQIV
jgi:taurine dioxygenase